MKTAKKVIYSGRVQGVGFRMTTRRVASRFQVAGHVRNLMDGSVEVVAEGDAAEVSRFLDAVVEAMEGYIDGQQASDEPTRGSGSFEIAY